MTAFSPGEAGGAGNGGGSNGWTIVAVGLAAVLIAGGILVARRRLSASGAR